MPRKNNNLFTFTFALSLIFKSVSFLRWNEVKSRFDVHWSEGLHFNESMMLILYFNLYLRNAVRLSSTSVDLYSHAIAWLYVTLLLWETLCMCSQSSFISITSQVIQLVISSPCPVKYVEKCFNPLSRSSLLTLTDFRLSFLWPLSYCFLLLSSLLHNSDFNVPNILLCKNNLSFTGCNSGTSRLRVSPLLVFSNGFC